MKIEMIEMFFLSIKINFLFLELNKNRILKLYETSKGH